MQLFLCDSCDTLAIVNFDGTEIKIQSCACIKP
jgi:hypothetical protein